MEVSLEKLRRAASGITTNEPGHMPGVEAVVESDLPPQEIVEAVSFVKSREKEYQAAQTRIKSCKTAADVFGEFGKDAAKGKVMESIMAKNSSDRQRAQETILDRSLGKVVDRTISINAEVASLGDRELNRRIDELQRKLGYSSGERDSPALLIGAAEPEGVVEAQELPTESRVSDEVHKESSTDPSDNSGEPTDS